MFRADIQYCTGPLKPPLITRIMGPTWGPPGADRTQGAPCWPHEPCYLGPYYQHSHQNQNNPLPFIFCHVEKSTQAHYCDFIMGNTLLLLPWLLASPGQPLVWRHSGHDGVSNHQPHDCLLKSLFRRRSKKTSKLRVTGLCSGNSPVTGEFPAQMASNAEDGSIWWRHHDLTIDASIN